MAYAYRPATKSPALTISRARRQRYQDHATLSLNPLVPLQLRTSRLHHTLADAAEECRLVFASRTSLPHALRPGAKEVVTSFYFLLPYATLECQPGSSFVDNVDGDGAISRSQRTGQHVDNPVQVRRDAEDFPSGTFRGVIISL